MKLFIKTVIAAAVALVLNSCGGCASADISQRGDMLYMISGVEGVMASTDGGRSWSSFSAGLPEDAEPIRFYSFSSEKNSHEVYLTTVDSGIFRLHRDNSTWKPLNNEPFRSRRQFKAEDLYRRVSAFTVDSLDPDRLFAATKHTLYISEDGGKSWQEFDMNGLHSRNYISSIAVKGENMAVGTAFNGVFLRQGRKFVRKNSGLYREPYSNGLAFTEEISYLAFGKTPETIYAGTDFGKGMYVTKNSGSSWKIIKSTVSEDSQSMVADIKTSGDNVYFSYGEKVYCRSSENEIRQVDLQQISGDYYPRSVLIGPEAFSDAVSEKASGISAGISIDVGLKSYPPDKKNKEADNRKAIYVPLSMMENPQYIIDVINSSGFDAAVIDMKDDIGNIYFEASNPEASQIGAQRPRSEVLETIKRLKAEDIYMIARVVVFKDQRLFHGFNSKYAIRDRETGKPWRGVPREFWVDPHSGFVHDYNIALSRDIEKLGFDEIQFDYIRFPSDGPVHRCVYPYKKEEDTYKSEPIVDFLYKAGEVLSVPVSVDIYGFNSWYRGGNWIGQDMEEFARASDVICPMVYPSHFGNRFYDRYDHDIRPERIIHDGGERTVKIVRDRVVVRPYLQAFRMLSPSWGTGYILGQAEGALESGCGGFTYWNARGRYDIIIRSFSDDQP